MTPHLISHFPQSFPPPHRSGPPGASRLGPCWPPGLCTLLEMKPKLRVPSMSTAKLPSLPSLSLRKGKQQTSPIPSVGAPVALERRKIQARWNCCAI